MSVTSARRPVPECVVIAPNLIGGKWQPALDRRVLDKISASDGQPFAKIAPGTPADIDANVRAP